MDKTAKITVVVVLILAVATTIAIRENIKADSESEFPIDAIGNITFNEGPAIDTGKVEKPNSLPWLIELGADKCVPCKMMAPILVELKKEYAGVFNVASVDVWKNPDIGRKLGARVIPTQIFVDASGKELYRHEGFFSKKSILATWEHLGVNMDKRQE